MTLSPTASLIDRAVQHGTAVPAFNVIGLESAEAIVRGAEAVGSAVLLQVSENAIRFRGRPEPLLASCRELASEASVPVGIHLDHVTDLELVDLLLANAVRLGVGSIMLDASTLPYGDNLAATSAVAARAHDLGLWVEAELGEIGGKDGAHAPGVRTDPDEARSFVDDTGVDGLAVAVGSSHAMIDRAAVLDLELIARLAATVPVPLVLHGSSGVSDDGLRAAVAAGIRKVNIGTALNVVSTAALRRELAAQPTATDPRRYIARSREDVADLVAQLCRVVG
ncbi:MAG: class II fructose-bisphosphate aldolase [Rhodoglobus sp.]